MLSTNEAANRAADAARSTAATNAAILGASWAATHEQARTARATEQVVDQLHQANGTLIDMADEQKRGTLILQRIGDVQDEANQRLEFVRQAIDESTDRMEAVIHDLADDMATGFHSVAAAIDRADANQERRHHDLLVQRYALWLGTPDGRAYRQWCDRAIPQLSLITSCQRLMDEARLSDRARLLGRKTEDADTPLPALPAAPGPRPTPLDRVAWDQETEYQCHEAWEKARPIITTTQKTGVAERVYTFLAWLSGITAVIAFSCAMLEASHPPVDDTMFSILMIVFLSTLAATPALGVAAHRRSMTRRQRWAERYQDLWEQRATTRVDDIRKTRKQAWDRRFDDYRRNLDEWIGRKNIYQERKDRRDALLETMRQRRRRRERDVDRLLPDADQWSPDDTSRLYDDLTRFIADAYRRPPYPDVLPVLHPLRVNPPESLPVEATAMRMALTRIHAALVPALSPGRTKR